MVDGGLQGCTVLYYCVQCLPVVYGDVRRCMVVYSGVLWCTVVYFQDGVQQSMMIYSCQGSSWWSTMVNIDLWYLSISNEEFFIQPHRAG